MKRFLSVVSFIFLVAAAVSCGGTGPVNSMTPSGTTFPTVSTTTPLTTASTPGTTLTTPATSSVPTTSTLATTTPTTRITTTTATQPSTTPSPTTTTTSTPTTSTPTTSTSPTTSAPTSTSTQPTTPTGPAPSGVLVIVQNYAYSPTDLIIPVGTTVTWKNLDADDHTATSDVPGVFNVYFAGDGGMGTFTFDTPGYFPYHCDYHAEMHGSVTVTA